MTVADNGFSITGYDFLGWDTNKNATTPTYTAENKTFVYNTVGDTTLYAIWQAKTIEITVQKDGATVETLSVVYGRRIQ